MLIPWLELTTLMERTERDVNDFAVPFACSEDGNRVFCWTPKTHGSLFFAYHTAPAVGAISLATAVADCAASFGVDVLRPDWEEEGADPSPGRVLEWLEKAWQVYDDQRRHGRREKPLILLVSNYEKHKALNEEGECNPWGVHSRTNDLVNNGPDLNIYTLVTYSFAPGPPFGLPGDRESDNMFRGKYASRVVMYDEEDITTSEVRVIPAPRRASSEQEHYDVDLLRPDQIAQGLSHDELGEE